MTRRLFMTVNLKRDAGNYFLTTIHDPDSYRAVQGVANARDATPGNPLEDIQTLKHVSFVLKDGVVFKHESESRP